MAFEEGREVLTCKICTAQHDARWSRMPVRERSTLNCQSCSGILYESTSVRDYFDVRLIEST